MIKQTIMALATFAIAFGAQAQEEGFKISGDFAASYNWDDTKEANNTTPALGEHNQLTVDLVEINLEKMMGNSKIHLGIGYGAIIQQTNGTNVPGTVAGTVDPLTGAPKNTLNLTNAYFQHTFDFGTSFRVGRMATFLGYESYNYMNNLNYNRSRAFDNLFPWWLTGLEVSHNFADTINVALYAVNTQASTDGDDNRNASFGASVAFTGVENLLVKANYITGKEGNNGSTGAAREQAVMEILAKYTMDAFDFGIDYMSQTNDFDAIGAADADASSIAAYVGWNQEDFGAALRYEMVDDGDLLLSGAVPTGTDNDFSTWTLSGYYNADTNARIMAEIMMDSSDKKIWADDKGVANQEDQLMRYTLGLMYRF